MSIQGVVEDDQLLDARVVDHRRARRELLRDYCGWQPFAAHARTNHIHRLPPRIAWSRRGAQSQVVDHSQACGSQSVTSEYAAWIEAAGIVYLWPMRSRDALHTTWRTIEDLKLYAIGRITPDRSLTVAVLNRRQEPPVDA